MEALFGLVGLGQQESQMQKYSEPDCLHIWKMMKLWRLTMDIETWKKLLRLKLLLHHSKESTSPKSEAGMKISMEGSKSSTLFLINTGMRIPPCTANFLLALPFSHRSANCMVKKFMELIIITPTINCPS